MTQARWSAYKTSVLRHTVYNAPARAVITLIPRRQSVHVGERGRASGASRTELYMKDAQELGIRSHVNPKRVEAFDRMDHSPSDAIRKSVKEDAARAGNVGDDRGRIWVSIDGPYLLGDLLGRFVRHKVARIIRDHTTGRFLPSLVIQN